MPDPDPSMPAAGPPTGIAVPIRIPPRLAAIRRRQGRLDESLAHLDRALRLRPGHPSARLNRASALEGLGRTAEARREYESLLRDQPPGSDLAARARQGLERLGPAR